jgi:DNA-binding NarL/FixJ family response regulator
MNEANRHSSWRVLLIGNNPIELSQVCYSLQEIPYKRILTELAFDLTSTLQRLNHFEPQHILIDDNMGCREMHKLVQHIQRLAGDVPITVVKNSNYQETIGSGVMNFVLKSQLSGEKLYREMINANHFRLMQQHWVRSYGRTRRRPLREWIQAAML